MVDLTYTVLLLVFVLFNIVIYLLRIPLMSMVLGAVSIAISAVAVTSFQNDIVFNPYPQLLLLLTVVICWLMIAVERR